MTDPLTAPVPVMTLEFLQGFVTDFFNKQDLFIGCAREFGSPLYILETEVLEQRARSFSQAFEKRLPGSGFYFAVKSNNLPYVSKILLKEGFGLDVSSEEELKTAISMGAGDILFGGPGKTDKELNLAVDHHKKVVLIADSIGEIRRLKSILIKRKKKLKLAIRVNHISQGLWQKFGIALDDLKKAWKELEGFSNISLVGLQFHSSWNLDPEKQVSIIRQLGRTLETMPEKFFSEFNFLDVGGGYWPEQGEWSVTDDPLVHHHFHAARIDVFADSICTCIEESFLNHLGCRIFFEPGRWVCNDALHILMTVIDKKYDDLVITDAGTNAVGWERFESDYFPVMNLSRPDFNEKPCRILGSLCTPHDVWGQSYFGRDIREGDLLMIPTQGAYTYSLRQHFIKALPKVAVLERDKVLAVFDTI